MGANDDREMLEVAREDVARLESVLDRLQAVNDRTFAAITTLIVDLDLGRADGTIYTYGHIQARLRMIQGIK